VNKIGFMQGRLLPQYKNYYQAHPVNLWQNEFKIANSLGLKNIEFIFDSNSKKLNPLMSDDGLYEINKYSKKYNVKVSSICADYFMDNYLFTNRKLLNSKNDIVIKKLIFACKYLKCKNIVLPFVDKSSLSKRKDSIYNIKKNLKKHLNFAKKNKINFSLESDLNPVKFLELIKLLNHPVYKINYDMGNSASLGYNSLDEIAKYGKYISVVHIKDRKYKGKSVFLGTGDVKFNDIFKSLSRLGFNGPITLQSFRNKEGLQVFKKQFFWIKKKYLNKYNL